MFVNRKAPRPTNPKPGRRIPTQERARKRFERILDAGAELFAEVGFETATMEEIAARAGTSIGSIYQFFPNKLAVFDEIARRYRDKLKAFFEEIVAGPLFASELPEIVDAAVEALWAFHDSEPGFRAVWVGLGMSRDVLTEGEALNRELSRRIESILAKKLPGLPAKKRSLVATMLVDVLTAMLIAAARRGKDDSAALKEETKTLLRRYLAPYEVRSTR